MYGHARQLQGQDKSALSRSPLQLAHLAHERRAFLGTQPGCNLIFLLCGICSMCRCVPSVGSIVACIGLVALAIWPIRGRSISIIMSGSAGSSWAFPSCPIRAAFVSFNLCSYVHLARCSSVSKVACAAMLQGI